MTTQLSLNPSKVHLVHDDKSSLIYHVPTGNLYEQDLLGTEIMGLFEQTPLRARQEIHQQLQGRFDSPVIDEVLDELVSISVLERQNDSLPEPVSIDFHLSTLVLHVNSGCNLACSYCYKEDIAYPGSG